VTCVITRGPTRPCHGSPPRSCASGWAGPTYSHCYPSSPRQTSTPCAEMPVPVPVPARSVRRKDARLISHERRRSSCFLTGRLRSFETRCPRSGRRSGRSRCTPDGAAPRQDRPQARVARRHPGAVCDSPRAPGRRPAGSRAAPLVRPRCPTRHDRHHAGRHRAGEGRGAARQPGLPVRPAAVHGLVR
jgi:hypothetical protein